jgi:hypothetical protein
MSHNEKVMGIADKEQLAATRTFDLVMHYLARNWTKIKINRATADPIADALW